MTFGKLDAGKPPVQFDEGRDWDRKLTTTVCLTPLSQSRLLYSAETPQFSWRLASPGIRQAPSVVRLGEVSDVSHRVNAGC